MISDGRSLQICRICDEMSPTVIDHWWRRFQHHLFVVWGQDHREAESAAFQILAQAVQPVRNWASITCPISTTLKLKTNLLVRNVSDALLLHPQPDDYMECSQATNSLLSRPIDTLVSSTNCHVAKALYLIFDIFFRLFIGGIIWWVCSWYQTSGSTSHSHFMVYWTHSLPVGNKK